MGPFISYEENKVLWKEFQALSTVTRLACKDLLGTNGLAYFALPSVTMKKKFVTLGPGVNVIKLFSFVTDDKA